jgi:L-threonylcarbamoyladenylate synthase
MNGEPKRTTAILPVDVRNIGKISTQPSDDDLLDSLQIGLDDKSPDVAHLRLAAEQLKHSDFPVAFPTETVYGLGADATRSAAVNGIYKAKQRPADNPLIVHFSSLKQVRDLLNSGQRDAHAQVNGTITNGHFEDPIPDIYKPLISNFWPGPLTIILRNPRHSPLAPEVTAGLDTFGARIPRNVLGLALIDLAGVPIAAPSANASTKPSPTAAEHVYHDLNGRIDTIIDGGPCDVGVESTVVNGLSDPPLILRPGGVSIEQLRACPGWENTQIGYKSVAETESKPKAPGMKYRHYSPKARVILYEAGASKPSVPEILAQLRQGRKVGIIATRSWTPQSIDGPVVNGQSNVSNVEAEQPASINERKGFSGMLQALQSTPHPKETIKIQKLLSTSSDVLTLEISLGPEVAKVARGIFSALRELDRENVDIILVEGIDDQEGKTAAAVMNRLRKAAEIEVAT